MSLKKEFLKPSGAIRISHTISLRQQQLWNMLFSNASGELSCDSEFRISLDSISDCLGLAKKRTARIEKWLKGLTAEVEFTLLEPYEEKRWGCLPLLKKIEIEHGVCIYSFDERLKKHLCESERNTEINLEIEIKFKSKFALFLYELALDYKDKGRTPWLAINDFKKYMGIEQESYPKFKNLKHFVIKKAIKEVNEKSDILVEEQLGILLGEMYAVRFWVDTQATSPRALYNSPQAVRVTQE